MELWAGIAGLAFAIAVVEYWVVKGVNNREHRLLPAVLACVVLYFITRVAIHMKPEMGETLRLFEDLVTLQLIFVMIPYIWDFFKINLKLIPRLILFLFLIGVDVYILTAEWSGISYRYVYIAYCMVGFVIMFTLWLNVGLSRKLTEEWKFYHRYFGVAILVPAAGIVTRVLWNEMGSKILSACFIFDLVMVLIAIYNDYLIDEEKIVYYNVFEASDLAMLVLDTDYNFVKANNKAKALFPDYIKGLEENPLGDPFLAQVRTYIGAESLMEPFDVEGRYYEIKVTPVLLKGEPRGFIATFVDITNVARKADEFLNEKYQAEEQVLKKSKFLARMSHNLRSPLHTIIGLSDILLTKKGISRTNKDIIFHLRTAGDMLLSEVNEILDFSKLEAGEVTLTEDEYDIYNLITEVVYQALVNLKDRPVKVRLNFMSDFPVVVYGDEMKVREIMQNLVSNAVKFTYTGTIDIMVDFVYLDSEKVEVSFTVKDTGIGMTKEQLDVAFKEYNSYADTHAAEGTGLGLSIVAYYVNMMGGEVKLNSTENIGTTVSATFIQKDANKRVKTAEVLEGKELRGRQFEYESEQKITTVYPTAKVLVADDFEVNVLIFEEAARPYKFNIVPAYDGKEALDKALSEEFDIIVLDQMMPKMTGSEAARELKKKMDVPIILMSAAEERETADIECFDAVLAKPINPTQFRTTLEKFLPEEKKELLQSDMVENYKASMGDKRLKILRAFVNETTEVLNELPKLRETDIYTFRSKVHGIKGTLRQIGRNAASDEAEIMEMAAKAEHYDYIERKLPEFIAYINEEVDDIRTEIEREEDDVRITKSKVPSKEKEGYFNELKEGFKTYDITRIDKALDSLNKIKVSADEEEILSKAISYADELEYEKGYELFN